MLPSEGQGTLSTVPFIAPQSAPKVVLAAEANELVA
jgi:hypothetical protein